jgi:plastocyanin
MRRWLAIVALASLVVGGCGGSGTTTPAEDGAASAPAPAAGEPGDVVIVINDDGFDPAEVTVPATTRLVVRNEGTTEHSLISDDVSSFNTFALEPGEEEVLYATVPGVYPFHCESHPEEKGTLTIEG